MIHPVIIGLVWIFCTGISELMSSDAVTEPLTPSVEQPNNLE